MDFLPSTPPPPPPPPPIKKKWAVCGLDTKWNQYELKFIYDYLVYILLQLLFLNPWKRKNEHRNIFIPKSSKKNVPDVGMIFQAAKLLPKLLLQVYCFVKFDTI